MQNPLLWSLAIALLISISRLGRLLNPASPHFVSGLGWIAGALQWLSNICVPGSLFANGVWMHGKRFSGADLRKVSSQPSQDVGPGMHVYRGPPRRADRGSLIA